MAQGADISAILAALQCESDPKFQQCLVDDLIGAAAQQSSGTPGQAGQQPSNPPAGLPFPLNNAQQSSGGFSLPAPSQVGNLDLSKIQPSSTGSVDVHQALAQFSGRGSRDDYGSRPYSQARDRSRSPVRRDNFRDGHNPYRDERRDDNRRNRDRSRSPGRPGSGAPSRNNNDFGSDTITVDSSAVGLIIGRAGENMRRIESGSGARVQFITGPESSGMRRQCRVSGTKQQREAAIRDIYAAAAQNQDKQHSSAGGSGSGGASAGPPGRHTSTPQNAANAAEGEETDQIQVPDRTVGLIIGRGGETIRDLQERSGCHVNILGENRSVNGLRPVNLIGSIEASERAKQMIYEIVESDTRGAPNMQALQQQQQPPRRDPPSYGQQQPPNPYASYGQPPAYNSAPQSTNEKITDSTTVPSEAVGMIIGKGGETIKDMQNSSGCKINVHQPSGADLERSIELIGNSSAIEHAKRLIWDKVQTVREKQGGLTRGPPESSNPYNADPYGRPNASTPAYSGMPQSIPGMPSGQQGPPAAAPDPYAAYGGYANYVAMWNAASAHYPGGMPPQGQ